MIIVIFFQELYYTLIYILYNIILLYRLLILQIFRLF